MRSPSTSTSATLTVQSGNPTGANGKPGVPGGWYVMPDVTGLKVAQASDKLSAAGFSNKDHFVVLGVSEPGCDPFIVCRTNPVPGTRVQTETQKLLYVGQPVTGSRIPDGDLF